MVVGSSNRGVSIVIVAVTRGVVATVTMGSAGDRGGSGGNRTGSGGDCR